MTTNSAHVGSYPGVGPLTLPTPRSVPWGAITASISRAFGRLASAASVGAVGAEPGEPGARGSGRHRYLEQAAMSREMYHL
ncbi:hypothetical protein [[Mycobacterium] wendilense]|uniref:Uncharacterized protein n=1 Tax=[Mycobacterium] wendilense TaxID=3064284 RepID=A0ABM9M8N8_9MYCO|nr:hypothetical protein [Mycolicibacterium sp. MU0050]CAJ1579133.1 hypothetical protein MU0050_000355 [Mycolicibacterium sp. MU0050]